MKLLGGVKGSALLGGGPGLWRLAASKVAARGRWLSVPVDVILEVPFAEIVEAIEVVGPVETLLWLPVQPLGDVGGERGAVGPTGRPLWDLNTGGKPTEAPDLRARFPLFGSKTDAGGAVSKPIRGIEWVVAEYVRT